MKTSNRVRQNHNCGETEKQTTSGGQGAERPILVQVKAAEQVQHPVDVPKVISGATYTKDALRRAVNTATALLVLQANEIASIAEQLEWNDFSMEHPAKVFADGARGMASHLADEGSAAVARFENSLQWVLIQMENRHSAQPPAEINMFEPREGFYANSSGAVEEFCRSAASALRLNSSWLLNHGRDDGAMDLARLTVTMVEGALSRANAKLVELVEALQSGKEAKAA